MTIIACPTAVVAAGRDVIWALLTQPERYDRWTGAQLVSVSPEGDAQPGQRIEFRVRSLARTWPVTFDVGAVREPVTLELDVRIPFGIVNHELIALSQVDASHTRVTFN